jgi:hypothetical protein
MNDATARALPTGLKAKLAPLLRLQASDNDGERANASAAIGRLLKTHGLDWHDLTEVLLAEPKTTAPDPQPAPDATSSWKRSAGAIDLPRSQLIALLAIVEERSPFLPLKSASFVSSLRSRAWQPTVHLSEKQWAWLQDLLQATRV